MSLFPESEQRSSAIEALSTLDETEAAKSMGIAQFYEKRNNPKAAAIYYLDVARSGTSFATEAKEKLNELSVEDLELGALAPSAQGGSGLDAFSLPSRDDSASAGLLGGPASYSANSPSPTTKARPDYLGPPDPERERLLRKPQMRTSLPPTFVNPNPNLPPTPTPPPAPSGSLFDTIDTEAPLTDPPTSTTPVLPDAPKLDFPEDDAAKTLEEIEAALKDIEPDPAPEPAPAPEEPDPAP